jgi:signal transduction histidine kinase
MDIVEIHILTIFGLVFIVSLLALLIYIVVLYRKKQERFEKELLRSQVEIQEATFNDISQEIHDNVGQVLTVAKMQLNLAISEGAEQKPAQLLEIKDNVSKAMADLRDIAKGLSSARATGAPLEVVVEDHIARINKSGVIEIGFSVTGDPRPIEPEKKLILFRVIQECVQNTIKHANARHVDVQLAFGDRSLIVKASDDGDGFDMQQSSGGLGLHNITNRCRVIGAKVNINSQPGKGTRIDINLPYEQ